MRRKTILTTNLVNNRLIIFFLGNDRQLTFPKEMEQNAAAREEETERLRAEYEKTVPKHLHWQMNNFMTNLLNCFVTCSLYDGMKNKTLGALITSVITSLMAFL